ncbi:hypothetical protein P3W85_16475 [Cupriavidus basilensis]|uniref:Secretin/TonB short N-terminal domain-containing protein n=1 Tax=Cupriavidus basilensis TaxID=68895 RepID=A0ABT6API4_9BURK|nr:hypothetical protein [Cupriavidus basilensis]MDF3834539.1 hypothetical protein [Cupriavidus basilensis]
MLCGLAASASAWGTDSALAQRSAGAQPAVVHPPGQLLDFDIPAQPLAAALNRYASLSGWPILFRGTMVVGRTSSPVQGRYLPEIALRRLLDGTGLTPEQVAAGPADAYILKEVGSQSAGSGSGAKAVDFDYGGWVQARIWEALCADSHTTPGTWRSLLRFRVDAGGHIHGARMLSSTGGARRDAAVLEALQRVRVGRSPPPEMAQPLTMLVLPFAQSGGRRCDNASIDAGARGAS